MHSSMGSCEFEIRLNCLHEHKYQNRLEYQTQTSSNFTIFYYEFRYDIWLKYTGLKNLIISTNKDLANNCGIS